MFVINLFNEAFSSPSQISLSLSLSLWKSSSKLWALLVFDYYLFIKSNDHIIEHNLLHWRVMSGENVMISTCRSTHLSLQLVICCGQRYDELCHWPSINSILVMNVVVQYFFVLGQIYFWHFRDGQPLHLSICKGEWPATIIMQR